MIFIGRSPLLIRIIRNCVYWAIYVELSTILCHQFWQRYVFLIFDHVRKLLALLFTAADFLDEGVVEKFVYWPSLLNIFLQTFFNKITVFRRKVGLFKPMGILSWDKIHSLQRRKSKEGRLSFCQFNSYDSHWPNIHKLVVKLFFNQFRSHPSWSSYNWFSIFLLFGELNGKSKVSNFDASIFSNENVVAL